MSRNGEEEEASYSQGPSDASQEVVCVYIYYTVFVCAHMYILHYKCNGEEDEEEASHS